MALKEFCIALQKCANKLEEEIKYNINEVHNIVYSNKLNETKMALEKAKDYHYKEIMDSIGEILKNIKKILFHQDKIDWLSNESNFTQDDLRRYSYVKRQVYVFSNPSETTPVPTPSIKKENRRTASIVSIGSLEAWENYLDQKENEEKQVEEKVAELKPLVPKRILSNARRRKKFVSSTLGGFLEGDERRKTLDSIFEDASSPTEENETLSYSKSLDCLNKMILDNEKGITDNERNGKNHQVRFSLSRENKNIYLEGSLESLHSMACDNERNGSTEVCSINQNVEEPSTTKEDEENKSLESSFKKLDIVRTDAQKNNSIMDIINDNMPKDEDSIINEIMNTFLDDTNSSPLSTPEKVDLVDLNKEIIKPKIVDVIYKKKPS